MQTTKVASQSEQPDVVSLDPPAPSASPPTTITLEMYNKLKKELDQKKNELDQMKKENINVTTENVTLKVRNKSLSNELREAKVDRNYFRGRANHYFKITLAQKNGKFSTKKALDAIVRQRMKSKLSKLHF